MIHSLNKVANMIYYYVIRLLHQANNRRESLFIGLHRLALQNTRGTDYDTAEGC